MKLTYTVKKTVTSYWERGIAALWNYAIPITFLIAAGRTDNVLAYLFLLIGAAPLFVRFKL